MTLTIQELQLDLTARSVHKICTQTYTTQALDFEMIRKIRHLDTKQGKKEMRVNSSQIKLISSL